MLCPLSPAIPSHRQKHAKQLTAGPDPKLLITDGREKTDGFGTTGQVRCWAACRNGTPAAAAARCPLHSLLPASAQAPRLPCAARCLPCSARLSPSSALSALCLQTASLFCTHLLQDPSTLVTWKHNPKNALFYGNQKDVVPFSGAWNGMLSAGVSACPIVGMSATGVMARWHWLRCMVSDLGCAELPTCACCPMHELRQPGCINAQWTARVQKLLAAHPRMDPINLLPPAPQTLSWRRRCRAHPRPSTTAAPASPKRCSPGLRPHLLAAQLEEPPVVQSQQAAAGEQQQAQQAQQAVDRRGGERRRWRRRRAARGDTTSWQRWVAGWVEL